MQLKFKNIPIPEAHIIGIMLNFLVWLFFPARIFSQYWIGHLLGWPLVVIGLLIAAWAAAVAGEVTLASPEKLITSGPYAYSRNPMYVGWTLIFLGIVFILNTIYSLGLVLIVCIYTHFFEIRPEEKFLKKKFGAKYQAYKKNVRRYL